MPANKSDLQPSIRPSWLKSIVTESQYLAGRSHLIDLEDARPILTSLARSLPAPTNHLEHLILRGVLLDIAWQYARTIHERAHEGLRHKCSFVPAILLDCFLNRPAQNPATTFLDWLETFLTEFRRTHETSPARRVARLIRENYQRRWSIAVLAAGVHVTPSQLRRAFQREFGVSIREYQRTMRLTDALAQMPGGKIEAIALRVGYRSKKGFYRAFRQVTGLTPIAFLGLPPERSQRIIESIGATASRRVRRG